MKPNDRIPKRMHERIEELHVNVGETFKDEEGFTWQFTVIKDRDYIECAELQAVEPVFM